VKVGSILKRSMLSLCGSFRGLSDGRATKQNMQIGTKYLTNWRNATITEAWGPINYDEVTPGGTGGEWDWVKDIAEHGVRMPSERGWQGICTSNFCQPHFEGMWADVGWHKRMTDLILRR